MRATLWSTMESASRCLVPPTTATRCVMGLGGACAPAHHQWVFSLSPSVDVVLVAVGGALCVSCCPVWGWFFQMGNKGAFIRLPYSMEPEFVQFTAVVRGLRAPALHCSTQVLRDGLFTSLCAGAMCWCCLQPHPPVECMRYAAGFSSMFGL